MKSLTYQQRSAIARGIRDGKSNAQIARELHVHRSTVGREISRNAVSRTAYEAEEADTQSWQRKQDAARGYRPFQFGGLPYFTILSKHDRFYTFFSRTHLCYSRFQTFLFPASWNPSYIRLHEKMPEMPDCMYERFRLPNAQGSLKSYSNKAALHFEHPAKSELTRLSKLRMPWQTTFMPHTAPEKQKKTLEKFHISHRSMVKQGVRNNIKITVITKNSSNSTHISSVVKTGKECTGSIKAAYRSAYRHGDVFRGILQSTKPSINDNADYKKSNTYSAHAFSAHQPAVAGVVTCNYLKNCW